MKNEIETDIHCLELRYASMRLQSASMIEAMKRSIEQNDQITAVTAIREQQNQYVLMDGYLRLSALKQLGRDTVRINVWECDEACGLIRVLCKAQSHQWAAIEEARTIQWLIQQHDYSQSGVGRMIGRDVSWVNRRLSLIEGMDEDVLQAVCKSQLSTWAASRVIAPLARAKGEHAKSMIKFLDHHPLSTRELTTWHQHYEHSNKAVREQMVKDPALFLAALTNRDQEKQAENLRNGPEGAWLKDMNIIKAMLKRQQQNMGVLFCSPHNREDQQPLRQAFDSARVLMEAMHQELKQ